MSKIIRLFAATSGLLSGAGSGVLSASSTVAQADVFATTFGSLPYVSATTGTMETLSQKFAAISP